MTEWIYNYIVVPDRRKISFMPFRNVFSTCAIVQSLMRCRMNESISSVAECSDSFPAYLQMCAYCVF